MTINTNISKKTASTVAAGILPGLQKHFPNASQVLGLGGGTTVAQATSKLETLIGNRTAVTTAQAAARTAVATEDSQLPALIAFLHALETFIRLNFDDSASALADFSLEPPKARTPQTAETKAIAKVKAKATREARGTTTKKAKQAIKGNVSVALVVTPDAAPAAATPAPAAPAAPVAPTKS
jgi:hypothetical protein